MNNFICKNILLRGFIFKCEQCDNSGWYNKLMVCQEALCPGLVRQLFIATACQIYIMKILAGTKACQLGVLIRTIKILQASTVTNLDVTPSGMNVQ